MAGHVAVDLEGPQQPQDQAQEDEVMMLKGTMRQFTNNSCTVRLSSISY